MGKLKESEYSLIDGKSLEGMLYVKIEQMPEQELELLLAKPLWTLTEALQVACNRKLSFPSSCFITREVAYVLRQFKMAVKNKEIKVEPTKDCQIENHRDLMISDESASVILKISFSQQDRLIISAASFIEWAVNSGIPLPEAVLKKIGISPLIEHSFESYWGRIREDIFNLKMRTIRKISQPRREKLQQMTAVQVWLIEKPRARMHDIENCCVAHGFIPRGGYEGIDTFGDNIRRVLPKRMMCSKGEFKHYDRLEPKILCGIVQENSRIYEDLRELKIVCQCIGLTFKSINPSVSMEKIVSHLLTQEYMKGCHPIVLQMCEHWIKELSFF